TGIFAIAQLPDLRELSVTEIHDIDNDFLLLLTPMAALELLEARSCSKITNAAVELISNYIGPLKSLELSGNEQINCSLLPLTKKQTLQSLGVFRCRISPGKIAAYSIMQPNVTLDTHPSVFGILEREEEAILELKEAKSKLEQRQKDHEGPAVMRGAVTKLKEAEEAHKKAKEEAEEVRKAQAVVKKR
ncbi:MAG TPA: hypothetical protein VN457_03760, partial [Chlamydiales bacterium]|nr:hypothetical protein [Chlamydiales bacterium]